MHKKGGLSYQCQTLRLCRNISDFELVIFCLLCTSFMASSADPQRIVILGGGVAGVTCCQEISSHISSGREPVPPTRVTLVAAKGLLKGVKNVVRLTRKLETFDIVDKASIDIAHCSPFHDDWPR
jgi:hypothetical protein